jgi:hypothetical protein
LFATKFEKEVKPGAAFHKFTCSLSISVETQNNDVKVDSKKKKFKTTIENKIKKKLKNH